MGRDAQQGHEAAALAVCQKTHPGHTHLHEEENRNGKIRLSRRQERGARAAHGEGRKTSLGQGRQGEQPRASDRHWPFRGAQAWRQGPKEEVLTRTPLNGAKSSDNRNQLFSPVSYRKQTTAIQNKCQFFAMRVFGATRQCFRVESPVTYRKQMIGAPAIRQFFGGSPWSLITPAGPIASQFPNSSFRFQIAIRESCICAGASHNSTGGII